MELLLGDGCYVKKTSANPTVWFFSDGSLNLLSLCNLEWLAASKLLGQAGWDDTNPSHYTDSNINWWCFTCLLSDH